MRLRPGGRADDRQQEIEFRCGGENVERGLDAVVTSAGDGEIDEARGLDLDPGAGEAGERRRAGRLRW
jgi:hypothetical protein